MFENKDHARDMIEILVNDEMIVNDNDIFDAAQSISLAVNDIANDCDPVICEISKKVLTEIIKVYGREWVNKQLGDLI